MQDTLYEIFVPWMKLKMLPWKLFQPNIEYGTSKWLWPHCVTVVVLVELINLHQSEVISFRIFSPWTYFTWQYCLGIEIEINELPTVDQYFLLVVPTLWWYGMSSFQERDTKLDRFFGQKSISSMEIIVPDNLSNFVSHPWKLDNPYYHIRHYSTK